MVKVTKSDMYLVVEQGKEDCVMLVYELVRVVKKKTVTKLTAVKPEFK